MRRGVWIAVLCLIEMGCVPSEETPTKMGRVEGHIHPESARGNAFVFLTEGSSPQALPTFVTAVSDVRLARGDRHFRFDDVPPNPYRLSGLLDVNGNFRPDVTVLAQASAQDRLGVPRDINLQPGQTETVDLTFDRAQPFDPPAFQLVGRSETVIEIENVSSGLVTFELQSLTEPFDSSFRVGLSDVDGNGSADDLNSDGVPDLTPQIFLRFRPRPGQTVPEASEVILPLAFSPGPFLAELGGDLTRQVAVRNLTVVLIPAAQSVSYPPGKGRTLTALAAVPAGDYELWVVQESGQFWHLPNALETDGQGVRFEVGNPR